MTHSIRILAFLSLVPHHLHAENNNLLLIGTTALVTGVVGGAIGYYAKGMPPHTLDTLQKRAAVACKKMEGIESADPLVLMTSNGERALEYIAAFDRDAAAIVQESFDPRFIASLKPEESAPLELVRKNILEKQHVAQEKRLLMERLRSHTAFIQALQNTPAVPVEQIGSRVMAVDTIKKNIDLLSRHLEQSRRSPGAEKMRAMHDMADQRIKQLIAQQNAIEQSAEYARELADLKIKTTYQEAETRRLIEQRTTTEMVNSLHESQRRLEKAEKMAADALTKESAAAATVLAAEWKVRKAYDSEQEARTALSREQLKSTKLELSLQQSHGKVAEYSQKIQSAQQEIARLKASSEPSEYYRFYIRKQATSHADTAKAFDALEREVKQPSINPENHQEWRTVLTQKIEATRTTAIPTCAICTEEITSDLFVTECDQGVQKATHEYHHGCLRQQKRSAGATPLTCAQCRARIRNASSIE